VTDSPRTHVAEVIVQNREGVHARPAAEFVKLANRYESDVQVSKDDLQVNGKSIMGVMMLAAEQGTTLRIHAEGADAEDCVQALSALIHSGFGEG
jgi:phosphocarrier protein HPr